MSRDYENIFFLTSDLYCSSGKDIFHYFQPKKHEKNNMIVITNDILNQIENAKKLQSIESIYANEVLNFIANLKFSNGIANFESIDFKIETSCNSLLEMYNTISEEYESKGSSKTSLKIVSDNPRDIIYFKTKNANVDRSEFNKIDPGIVNKGLIDYENEDLEARLVSNNSIPIDGLESELDQLGGNLNTYIKFPYNSQRKFNLARFTADIEYSRDGSDSIIGVENRRLELVDELEKSRIMHQESLGIIPQDLHQALALNAIFDPKIRFVAIYGNASSGKTLMAYVGGLAQTLYYNKKKPGFEQLLFSKPFDLIGGKYREQGFLRGDETEKAEPFLKNLQDMHENTIFRGIPLDIFMNRFEINEAQKKKTHFNFEKNQLKVNNIIYTFPSNKEVIMYSDFAKLRGRSIKNAITIIDESQNLTQRELRDILTRQDTGSKTIITGDFLQIDNPYLSSNNNGFLGSVYHFLGRSDFQLIKLQKLNRSAIAQHATTWKVK